MNTHETIRDRGNRLILGLKDDVRITAAYIKDPNSENRIIDAIDHEVNVAAARERLKSTLKSLSPRMQAFLLDVLSGETWRTMGMSKRTFNWRVRKILKKVP